MDNATVLKLLTPISIGGDMDKLTAAEGAALDRLEAAIAALENEIYPSSVYDTLASWERVYGVTVAADATLAERRLALMRKVRATGGYSRAYFITLAAVYGQNITITEHIPPRCGQMLCGDRLCVEDAVWMWTVDGLTEMSSAARCGSLCCGERLGKTAPGIETLFEELKPAHTLVNFVY